MNAFRPSQAYDPALDIRLGEGWAAPGWVRPLLDASPPNSAAWLVVMPRRAGKTWLARGIAHARPPGTTTLVDLRAATPAIRAARFPWLTDPAAELPVRAGGLLIVDEPALAAGGLEAAGLAECLDRVHRAGGTAVVLATPAEHDLLIAHLGPDGPKDVRSAPPLDAVEQARMAARAPDWAPALIHWLGEHEPAWLHTPFLLELALRSAEERPGRLDDPAALLRAAAEEALGGHHVYIEQWFHNGLAPEHRARLRAGRWRDAGLTGPAAELPPDGLTERLRLAQDPVLAHHLPEVLRIHHISDLHHGGSMRKNVDVKDKAPGALAIATKTGAGSPMDSYLQHVRQLAEHGRAPHLVVVTGDVVDRPLDENGEQALVWLRALEQLLADHRDLPAGTPRVLLVGGNHDVSWNLVRDPSPQARHQWFADTFRDYPHPDLHEADPGARRLYITFPEVGLRFALLGTAESGGEDRGVPDPEPGRAPTVSPDRSEPEHSEPEHPQPEHPASGQPLPEPDHLDPGLVARGVLDRLAAETGYVTVAALHHPPSPVPTVEVAPYSGIVNAGQVKRALSAAETALVLHGHTHLAFAAAERILGLDPPWTMRIAGAPALATSETEERNGYNELFVAREGGAHAFALRTVRLDGGTWTASEPPYGFRPGAARERTVRELCQDRWAPGRAAGPEDDS
ncbi:metallophosphoesterase [Streptomyces polygonati]|uniref:Metallophosphoesterase n=1 Tax=Streptomyces polygonati TaxID=1617087 RepID=A0ABV8HGE0_9ACTN